MNESKEIIGTYNQHNLIGVLWSEAISETHTFVAYERVQPQAGEDRYLMLVICDHNVVASFGTHPSKLGTRKFFEGNYGRICGVCFDDETEASYQKNLD